MTDKRYIIEYLHIFKAVWIQDPESLARSQHSHLKSDFALQA